MIAILGEDTSDVDTLNTLIRRMLDIPNLTTHRKGYDGCDDLCRKGARDIAVFAKRGYRHFVICHDADGPDPQPVAKKVQAKILAKVQDTITSCVAVPVQEIEAWMIADEAAIRAVIPRFEFKGHSNPERIGSPKEWLRRQSRAANSKPLYVPAVFNRSVAAALAIDKVANKCASFRRFRETIEQWEFATEA